MSEEVSVDVIKKTQKALGKYVKKPQLTEKLLKKPPFRFLHDIVTTVIKETGFLNGLFTEDELVSDNVKDKDAKVAFLNKLIEAVKSASGSKLSVKANKIVAGLEATNTNLLLQAIAKSLDSKVDTKKYVTNVKADSQNEKNKKSIPNVSKDDKVKSTHKKLDTPKKSTNVSSVRKEEGSNKGKVRKTSKNEEKGNTKHTTEKESTSTDDDKAKTDKKEIVTDDSVKKENEMKDETNIIQNIENIPKLELSPKEEERNINKTVNRDDNNEKVDIDKEENVNKAQIRPKSARPRSGDMEKIKTAPKNNTDQQKDLKPSKQIRPKSSLRPPSVRPSSARPGAPRLRPDSAIPMHEPIPMGTINVIVENVDSTADEEETVVIETATVEPEPAQVVHQIELDNKGHLVEQILEQIEGESGKKMDMERENILLKTREGATKDITQLAGVIQNLTKTANPLGKLINFLHEDIEAMHSELQLWINTKKQLYAEIRKQKKLNIESNKPLLTHMEQLNHEIKKIQQEITNINCNTLKNDNRIKELLCK